MILPITKFGNHILRKEGKVVKQLDQQVIDLMNNMLETTLHENGIGLAAHQVGVPLQLALVLGGINTSKFIVNGVEIDPESKLLIYLINPKVKPLGKVSNKSEGCLSLKDMFAKVKRQEEVELSTFWDPIARKPKQTTIIADGLTARAIQHEMDHLKGVLFTDYISPEDRHKFAEDLRQRNNGTTD